MNYVICAAGEGARFRPVFGDLPKPLIRLRGATLMEWALRSLPIVEDDRLVVLTQARHGIRERLEPTLRERYPFNRLEWVELPGLTGGQLVTVLAAAPHLERAAPLVVYNSDTFFQSRTLPGLMADERLEGIVPCSQQPGEAWSFCAIDEHDRVVGIEEKKRISPWATVGLYFFRDTPRFLRRAEAAVARGSGQELYVAPLYQDYIAAGETVVIDRVCTFRPMGTPDQVETYWETSMERVGADNAGVTPAAPPHTA